MSPPSIQRLCTCRRRVFEERLDEARCSMKGRKQTTSSSPGGRSFSSPIHERGQLSRSRQAAEASEDAAAVAARFTLEVFAMKIVRAMELITILNLCFAKIPCALKMVRFPATMAASSRSSLHPRTPRICPGEPERYTCVYKDGGTRTSSRRCVASD